MAAYNRLVGNVGDDVGPVFFSELLKLRQATIQGVNNYPADICISPSAFPSFPPTFGRLTTSNRGVPRGRQ